MGEPNSSQQQNHLRNAEDEACARELLVLGSNHATKRKSNLTRTRTSAVKKEFANTTCIMLSSNNEHSSEATLVASNGHHELHDNENDDANDEEAFTFISDSDGSILVEPTLNSAILTGGGSSSVGHVTNHCDKGSQRIIMHVPNTVNHSSVASSISDFKFAHALDGNLTDAENSDEEHDDVEKQPQSSSSVVVPRNSSQSDDDANQVENSELSASNEAISSNSIMEGIEEVDPNQPIDYSKKSNSSFNSSSSSSSSSSSNISSLGGTVAGAASSSPHPLPQPISTNAMISSTSSKAGIGGSSSKKGFSILSVENLISKSPPRHQTQTTIVAAVGASIAASSTNRLESSLVPYHPKEEEESCDEPLTTTDKSDLDKGQQGFQQETISDIESSTRHHDDLQENQKEDDLEADLPQVVIRPQPPSPPAPTEVPESSNMASLSIEPPCSAKQIFKDTSENEESRAQNADELEGARISTDAVVMTEEVATPVDEKELVSTQKTEGKALDDVAKTETEALVEPANRSSETILDRIETTTTLTDQEADTTVQALNLPVSKTEIQSEVETSEPSVKPVETKANPLLETSDSVVVKPAEIVSPSIETMIPKACPIIETSHSVVVKPAEIEALSVDETPTTKARLTIETSDSMVAKPAEIVAPSVDETTTTKAGHIFARSDSVVAKPKPSPIVETSEIQAPSVDQPLTTKASQIIETSDSVVVKPAKIEIEASSVDETMTTKARHILEASDTVVAKTAEI